MSYCKFCRHGINQIDDGNGRPYAICTLIPPTPLIKSDDTVVWMRPTMSAEGWCGQYKLKLRKFFFRGPRT